jgi:hypothetical protein
MDYKLLYEKITKRGKENVEFRKKNKEQGGYYEGHHIVPTCLGGKGNSKDWDHPNIVPLTAREHFICHWILTRLYPTEHKLTFAFWAMCNQKSNVQKRYKPSSRQYEEAKQLNNKMQKEQKTGKKLPWLSERMKVRENNPNYKPGVKEKQRAAKLGKNHRTPEGQKRLTEFNRNRPMTWGWKVSKTRLEKGLGKEPKSKEHKMKIGDALRGKEKQKYVCPHCEKEVGGASNAKRWHFDNCKMLKGK